MIRSLGPADLNAFIALRRQSFATDPLSWDYDPGHEVSAEEWLPKILETDGQFVLGYFLTEGRQKPELAGVIGLTRYEKLKRRHRALVWGVYVSPAARGQQAARQLLTETIRRARAMEGLERIILTVSHHASAARALYTAAGFVEFGREPGASRNEGVGMDEIYMLLEL
ncbi:GNAT family N-acetyltransferase [Neolewinella lacunae]|uniref:N-acetyltransferase n=1 Tax=Neolewinella lacunae TaxID=1517758 RepID=A0A923T830_9BACT|nr:GNAT family N-acetyltransferase [Neolewinella lacunae]MBC6993523.1 N-acetyltransferase [Neolewinella lacunae]MDN3636201.1 GNAT family N-acetyltransferase [Neolewinella lacunae]